MAYDAWHALSILYMRIGLTADKPTRPPSRQAAFWDTEAGILYISDENQTWISITGSSPIPSGTIIVTTIDIAFDTTTPLLLRSAQVSETAKQVTLSIDTAFDGGQTYSVGNAGFANRLMATTQNDLTEVGVYATEPNYIYTGGGLINVYRTGSGTVGAGRLTLISHT